MNNIFNIDFQEFIISLNQQKVKYILVGGYSVILRGYSRTTGDMDIWIEPSEENFLSLKKAFYNFGMSMHGLTLKKFLDTVHYDVFTYGRPPVCIEILTKVKGLTFPKAYKNAEWIEFEDFKVYVLSKNDLIEAKKATNRPKDLDDLEHL
ncbi:MAG: hypothetical protein ACI8VT_001314 [Saprospiraceae bacterium]|jgi:hypothetical protein